MHMSTEDGTGAAVSLFAGYQLAAAGSSSVHEQFSEVGTAGNSSSCCYSPYSPYEVNKADEAVPPAVSPGE